MSAGSQKMKVSDVTLAPTGKSMAQLMILVNGLLLTFVLFAALHIFTHKMIAEEHDGFLTQVGIHVEHSLFETKQELKLARMFFSMEGAHAAVSVDERAKFSSLLDHEPTQQIFHIYKTVEGAWNVHELVSARTGLDLSSFFSEGSRARTMKYITAGLQRSEQDISVFTNLPGQQSWQESSVPLISSSAIFLVTKVKGDPGSLIVGVTSFDKIVGKGWLVDNARLSYLNLFAEGNEKGERFFEMTAAGRNRPADLGEPYEISFTVGNARWVLRSGVLPAKQMGFLRNLPWLVLGFGGMLTLIGMLYVRNNQKQSHQLSLMNRALAQKNYEMNIEIAERERLNEAVIKAEQEYRTIVNAVSDVIFETDLKGNVLFLNDAWEGVTGFSVAESLERNIFDLLAPQDQEEQRNTFEQMLLGRQKGGRFYTKLLTANDTYRAVEMSMRLLRQDGNRTLRVIGTFVDVEERRRVEHALTEAEKKYRAIVENAAGGIYQVTLEGYFLSVNPAMARILGYESPEQLLREVKNRHHDLYASAVERSRFMHELEMRGEVRNFEIEILTRGGEKKWINENARLVRDDEGGILYLEGSMEDITQRKEGDIKLREAKVQSDLANRAKSEFLANMSHELRTPLNSIIGFSEIIKNEVLGPVGQKQYWEYANDIYESGQRLLKIINEILDISRIEAGERQISEGLVDMKALMNSCLGFARQKAEEAGISIVNHIDDDIPQVVGEEVALKQIILNLLGNAIKYTPEAGRVTLSYECENSGRLRLSISDTGIGMDADEIEKALSPFGQLDTALSRSGAGAGLGLTLAQSLIELHGGELELVSQKRVGTTATIIFPAKRVVKEQAAENKSAAEQSAIVPLAGDEGAADSEGPKIH